MKNFINHAFEIKKNLLTPYKEMVENNLIHRGLVFLYDNETDTYDICYTNTRCYIIKKNVKLYDFKICKDFLIDLEIIKKDFYFKNFIKEGNIDIFIDILKNNEKYFDFDFSTKYKNFKETIKKYSNISEDNIIIPVIFAKIFEERPIQEFLETLKTSKFFDNGELIFNNNGIFFKKDNFKSELSYLIQNLSPFSSKEEPDFSLNLSGYCYKNLPTYDNIEGCIYKAFDAKMIYLDCHGYYFYSMEY